MRPPLAVLSLLFLLSSSFAFTQTGLANQDVTTAKAIAAFSQAPVQSVRLSGRAHAIAGSTNENGSFSFDLQSTGESKLELKLTTLSRTETTSVFASAPKCRWTGADGVQNDAAQHNCLLPVHWVVPVLALQSQGSKLNQSVASETDRSIAVQALSLNQVAMDSTVPGQKLAQLSKVKLSLDSGTMRPTSLSFDIHPDHDEGINIPIVVRYSDYRPVDGVSLPFRIQKFLNNGLVLDLTVESAEVQ